MVLSFLKRCVNSGMWRRSGAARSKVSNDSSCKLPLDLALMRRLLFETVKRFLTRICVCDKDKGMLIFARRTIVQIVVRH